MLRIKTLLIFALAAISFLACSQSKKLSSKKDTASGRSMLTTSISLSPFAKLFVADINKELASQNKNIESYRPSKETIDKYSIGLYNNEYFIQGFVTVTNGFAEKELTAEGVSIGKSRGDKKTVKIPIRSLPKFLNHPSIKYFELNPKGSLQ